MLNFRLLSRDTTDAYLAEGLADAITSRLSQVRRIDVASRTAARLGRRPDAAYIVSGTMLRQNRQLVVTVELLRASSGRNVWAQRYERPDTAVLGTERDIALGVASAMLPRIEPAERVALGGEPTRSPEAYDRLLRGDFLLAQRSLSATSRAIREYEAAARLDPAFATPHARIALACAIWMDWEWDRRGEPPPDSVLAKGIAAAARALTLDSASSDAWMGQAYIAVFQHPRAMDGVEAAFRRALALNPRNAEAHHQYGDWLSMVGRDAEGDEELRAALAIDPLRAVTLRNLAAGGGPMSLALADSAVRLDPSNFQWLNQRAYLRLAAGDTTGALADAQESLRLVPPESRIPALGVLASFYLAARDTTTARRLTDEGLALLAPDGMLGSRTLALRRAVFYLGQMDLGMTMLDRVRPRGALLWFQVMGRRTDTTGLPERIRRVLEDSKPPWIP